MKTWDEELKAHWIPIFKSHHAADRYIQGDWLRHEKDADGMHRGCAFGCCLQIDFRVLEEAEKQMELPGWLLCLIATIFDKLPKEGAPDFFLDVMRAIPCDANIESVKHAIAVKRLTLLAENNPEFRRAIQRVIDCHKNWKTCKEDEWIEARDAANRDGWYAGWAAGRKTGWSRGNYSVSNAAWSAEYSATDATPSSEMSAIWAANSYAPELQDDAWRAEAENLIEELEEVER